MYLGLYLGIDRGSVDNMIKVLIKPARYFAVPSYGN